MENASTITMEKGSWEGGRIEGGREEAK